tara:strand:+ start:5511 stop:7526 length:2016 start_codon:yes stop_codon:yes gene_type:complete
MFFGLLVLFTALTISAVAIWYSVAGLVAIFAAAAVPIIIMGTSLEIGKLVTALWLHRNWKRAKWWLKSYLTIAVVVLMFITSMGIFGFLSKAHIEQNLASDTVEQRIEILEGKIIAEEKYIERQNDTIDRISNKDKNSNNRFDKDIAIEQKKIDDAYARLEVLDKDVEAFTSNNKGWGGTKRVKQGLALKEQQAPEREALLKQIEKAQLKIDEIRSKNDQSLDSIDVKIEAVEKNIFDANSRIDGYLLEIEPLKGDVMKLESEVGPIRYIAEFVYGEEADRNLLEEAVRWVIITIIFVFDPLAVLLLIASQYHFMWRHEDKYGKLPPKSSPNNSGPDAPPSKKKIEPIIKQEDPVIEVDEPEEQVEEVEPKPLSSNGWNYNKPLSASKIKEFKEREKQEIKKLEAIAAEARAEEEKPKGLKLSDIVKQQEENKKLMQEQLASRNDIQDGFDPAEVEGYEEFNKKYEPVQDKADYEEELKQIKETADEITKTAQENKTPTQDQIDELLKEAEQNAPEDIKPEYTDFERGRLLEYEQKEKKLSDEKALWKRDNPTDTIKRHKEWYIKGIIDTLPWENYKPKEEEEPPLPLDQWNKMIAEAEKEVSKEETKKKIREEKDVHNEGSGEPNQNKVQAQRVKPDLTTVLPLNFELGAENYVQNEEQNNNSVWKNIKK